MGRTVLERTGDVIARYGRAELRSVGPYIGLFSGERLLMMDTPTERRTNEEIARRAFGHVIVCGLGLGLFIAPMLRNPRVRALTIVEKDCDVVRVVHQHVQNNLMLRGRLDTTMFCGDAFEFPDALRHAGARAHCVHFDIWTVTQRYSLEERREQLAQLARLADLWRPHLYEGGKMTAWLGGRIRDVR